MTPIQKRAFVDELINNVHSAIVDKIDDMPEEWDGIELRRYIADKFEESTIILRLGRVRSRGHSRRLRDYRNEVLVRNL